MKKLSILVLCAVLAACGGGGGNTASPAGPAQPSATLAVTSNVMRTVTGGTPITLNATLSSGGTVHWKLADGAPGTLSADTGASVKYTPAAINAADTPRASATAAQTFVPVTATGDGATATLTLAVAPNPGVPRLVSMDLFTPPSTTGSNLPASLVNVQKIAADGAGNIYVLDFDPSSTGTSPQVRLRKLATNGVATTLAAAATWFDAPDQSNNGTRLRYFSGLAADRAGNLYVSTAADGANPATAAILKLTPSGSLTLLAGSESAQAAAIMDGSGAAARFSHPAIAGIDPDDNLYVRDASDTLRKVTPAGVVTTVKAFPSGLNADMNGNTYAFDAAAKTVVRTAPDGSKAVVGAGADCTNLRLFITPACLQGATADIVPLGGASFAILSGGDIGLLVVTPSAPPPALALSSTTLRTIAGGTPVSLTASGTGTGAVSWKLGEGAPGTLSAGNGTTVTYTPPAGGITGTTLVPVTATRDGATARLTLAVSPDPGPAGLYFIAGNGQPSRDDGTGADASFLYPNSLTTDLAGNIYLYESYSIRPSMPPGFTLRKITPDGVVTSPSNTWSTQGSWEGQSPPVNYDVHVQYPRGLAVDSAGNVRLGQGLPLGMGGAGILKISQAGAASLLAGANYDQSAALLDGVGNGARFVYTYFAGIDYDDNLYVRDAAALVRKVTADGTVTTIPSVPRNLLTDMNGNTYTIDGGTIVRTTPSGQASVVAGSKDCTTLALGALPGCIPYVQDVVPYGGSALIVLTSGRLVKLVLPH